jgi:hypothetical protein
MTFSVDDIRSQLVAGGARPTLFSVQITNPGDSSGDQKLPFLCEASSIPEATLGTIEVPYFGRRIKLAGDRSYAPWSVTIINDEDFKIRNAMEIWSNKINSFVGNLRTFGSAAPSLYKSEAMVTQYGKAGDTIRIYQFSGLWPAAVSNMDVRWGDVDQIERFSVQFQYDYWTISGGSTGDGGGS